MRYERTRGSKDDSGFWPQQLDDQVPFTRMDNVSGQANLSDVVLFLLLLLWRIYSLRFGLFQFF